MRLLSLNGSSAALSAHGCGVRPSAGGICALKNGTGLMVILNDGGEFD